MSASGAADTDDGGNVGKSRQRNSRFLLVLAVGALAGFLTGCGQKGALYIPDTPAAAQRSTLPQTIFGTHKPADDPSRESAGKAPAKP